MLILFENGNEPYHTLPEVELEIQRAFGSRYGFRAVETEVLQVRSRGEILGR